MRLRNPGTASALGINSFGRGVWLLKEGARLSFPSDLIEFQDRFPDEESCWRHLREVRWPEGFECPEPFALQPTGG